MTVAKARPILIFTAIVVAVPALAQVEPSAVLGVARTFATTRIDQPATLSSSQDLAFAVQAPVAAALSVTPVAISTATPRVTAPAVQSATTTVPAVGASSTQSASTTAPNASSLVRGASTTVTAAVPQVAQATFTVAGDSGQAISVTVPQSVELLSSAGTEAGRLTTASSLGDGPQFLGGSFAGGGTMSFAVGGQVTLASNTTVSSGTYNGFLAVVAQYN